jgi:tRNA/rRNA methyltransferase/tRNA (cytidine32/uridine32-2'-O)-methyltransferase
MKLDDVAIVLCRPEEPGNVGAVCRAMKNMGLSRLRLAAPQFNTGETAEMPDEALPGALSEAGWGYGGPEAIIRARAIHAADIWEKAETFDTLAGAVKDCSLIIGTTRRRGRRRKQITMTPAELAVFLKERPGPDACQPAEPVALVFGNERTGLEDDELEICNLASHIPVNEDFPSLNLSHAVQIYAYELSLALSQAAMVPGTWVSMDQLSIEELVRKVTGNLKSLGFYTLVDSTEHERFFRDIFARAGITEREGRYFGDIIAKAARLATR